MKTSKTGCEAISDDGGLRRSKRKRTLAANANYTYAYETPTTNTISKDILTTTTAKRQCKPSTGTKSTGSNKRPPRPSSATGRRAASGRKKTSPSNEKPPTPYSDMETSVRKLTKKEVRQIRIQTEWNENPPPSFSPFATIVSDETGKRIEVEYYKPAKQSHFGLDLEECVLYKGKRVLPVDCDDFERRLEDCIEEVLGNNTDELYQCIKGRALDQAARILRNKVKNNIDVEWEMLDRVYNFKAKVGKIRAQKKARAANATPPVAPTTPSQCGTLNLDQFAEVVQSGFSTSAKQIGDLTYIVRENSTSIKENSASIKDLAKNQHMTQSEVNEHRHKIQQLETGYKDLSTSVKKAEQLARCAIAGRMGGTARTLGYDEGVDVDDDDENVEPVDDDDENVQPVDDDDENVQPIDDDHPGLQHKMTANDGTPDPSAKPSMMTRLIGYFAGTSSAADEAAQMAAEQPSPPTESPLAERSLDSEYN